MFPPDEKRQIATAVQRILRDAGLPEPSAEEIQNQLRTMEDFSDFSDTFTVKTFIQPGDLIVQENTDLVGQIHRKLIKAQDDQVRKALISLGWTPPDKNTQPTPRPIALCDRRPSKDDCTDEGLCWFGQPLHPRGIYSIYWSWDFKHRHSSLAEYERHWLPANVRQLPARITPLK